MRINDWAGQKGEKMIEELEIKMPSKGIQKEIVSILYALDSKIELNRRINDKLMPTYYA